MAIGHLLVGKRSSTDLPSNIYKHRQRSISDLDTLNTLYDVAKCCCNSYGISYNNSTLQSFVIKDIADIYRVSKKRLKCDSKRRWGTMKIYYHHSICTL